MTTRHTPGPWESVKQERDGAGTTRVRQAKPRHPDAEWLWVARDVRADADARLIAAAPELLHALKWAAEYVSLYTGDGAGWTGVMQGHDRERFICPGTGDLDPERLRAFLSETINKAEEG